MEDYKMSEVVSEIVDATNSTTAVGDTSRNKTIASQKSERVPLAAERVFDVTELLELILIKTSQTELFLVQRVNKTFNKNIQDSPSLQRKLFAPVSQELTTGNTIHDLRLHISQFGPKFQQMIIYSRPRPDERIMLSMVMKRSDDDGGEAMGWCGRDMIYPNGSWKGILLGAHQAGITVLRIRYHDRSSGWKTQYISASVDSTMGDLLAASKKLQVEDSDERSFLDFLI